jgi:DNA polymerase-3 subunit delta
VDHAAFLKLVERGTPPPVALLHGGDVQLLDDALARVGAALGLTAEAAALARDVFDGQEAAAEAVVRAAQTLPFLAPRRLVVVRRAQALPAKGSEALTAYLADPNPASCVLLLADQPLAAGGDRRGDHWLLQVVPPAAVVALPVPDARALPAWLRQRAALEGVTVSDEAARLLVQLTGDDAATLLGEVRKAALAGGPEGRTVGVREVSAVVGERRVGEVFELVRAVERRDAGLALRTLDRLLVGEDAMRLLALLSTQARVALAAADLAARGRSVDEIARLLRRPPRVVEGLVRGAEGRPRAALAHALERCWDAERRLKSSGEPRAELAALVADLCTAR